MSDDYSIEALRLRRQKLKEIHNEQIDNIHQIAEHNRRMLRLTFLLLGIIATGVGYLSQGQSGLIFDPNTCSLTIMGMGSCTPLNWVTVIAVFFYLFSIASFMGLANARPQYSIEYTDSFDEHLNSEEAYLEGTIDQLQNNIESGISRQEVYQKREDAAEFSLLFAILFTSIIWYTVVTGNAVNLVYMTLVGVAGLTFVWLSNRVIEATKQH